MNVYAVDCRRTLALRCVCSFALLSIIGQPGQAQSPRDEISINAQGARAASLIAASSDKVVVLAWYAGNDRTTSLATSVSRDGGGSFSQPVRVGTVSRGAPSLRPVLSVLSRGTVQGTATIVAAWPSVQQGQSGVVLAESGNFGKSFQELFLRPQDLPLQAALSSLAIAPDGRLHALWLAGSDLLYAVSDGRRMSRVRRVDTAASPCAVSAIVVSVNNVVTAFWYRTFALGDEEFAFARSPNGGVGAFSVARRASHERWEFKGCPASSPVLTGDANGAVRFVFQARVGGAKASSTFFTDRLTPDGVLQPRAFVETTGFTESQRPQLVVDREGGLSLGWEGIRNGRRYVVIRHSPAPPGGRGGLEGDWMRPGPPIVLDLSGQGTGPAIAPLSAGILAAWLTSQPSAQVVRTRRISVDELCGLVRDR